MGYLSPRDLLLSLNPAPGPSVPVPEGEVSGRALRDWRGALTRALGAGSVERLREATGLDRAALPDEPAGEAWFPVGHQLRLVQGALALRPGLGGFEGLIPLLVTPSLSLAGRIKRNLFRIALPPARLLGRAERIHADLYRPGWARAQVSEARQEARLQWGGGPFHRDPVWQALQVAALAGYFEAVGAPLRLAREPPSGPSSGSAPGSSGPDTAFSLALSWSLDAPSSLEKHSEFP
jgi:hypothetical protein